MKKLTYLALLWGFLGNLCAQQLVFRSGFEPGSTVINQTKDGADITGTDRSVAAPNDWVGDLEGSPYVGRFNLQYQDRDGNQQKKRRAEIVGDPTGSGRGRVLKYWILEDHVTYGRGRVQANMYEAETGVREYYHCFKMYLPTESFRPLLDADEGFGFLTITEIWNDNNWRPAFGTPDAYPYRVSLNISRPEASDRNLYLRATGEQQSRSCCWGEGSDKKWETISDYALPLDTWLDVEFYLKEGNDKTGRVQVAVTPAGGSKRLVVDVIGYTRHPDDPDPDGVKYSNPLKMYTSAGSTLDKVRAAGDTLKIYWDDFEFWKDRRIDLQEPTGCGSTIDWQNQSFSPVTDDSYTVTWQATPGGNEMNGLVGLSDGPAGAYGDLACIVRFNPEGYIDARSGGSYTAEDAIPYTAGTSYRVRLTINQADRTYSAYVTPAGGQERTIGTNLVYRSEQAQVIQLNNYAVNSERCTVAVSDFSATSANATGRILIRAKSSQGGEIMDLEVDGRIVRSWDNVSRTATDYTYDGYRGGTIRVLFNDDGGSRADGTDRNLAINYLIVCGQTIQQDAPSVTRTGCGTDNSKGFAWLWCNGSLDFGDPGCGTATAQIAAPPSSPALDQPTAWAAYPNPAHGQLTVVGGEDYRVLLYDLKGRLVLDRAQLVGTSTLDISPLPAGLYVVQVSEQGWVVLHQRLVVE